MSQRLFLCIGKQYYIYSDTFVITGSYFSESHSNSSTEYMCKGDHLCSHYNNIIQEKEVLCRNEHTHTCTHTHAHTHTNKHTQTYIHTHTNTHTNTHTHKHTNTHTLLILSVAITYIIMDNMLPIINFNACIQYSMGVKIM